MRRLSSTAMSALTVHCNRKHRICVHGHAASRTVDEDAMRRCGRYGAGWDTVDATWRHQRSLIWRRGRDSRECNGTVVATTKVDRASLVTYPIRTLGWLHGGHRLAVEPDGHGRWTTIKWLWVNHRGSPFYATARTAVHWPQIRCCHGPYHQTAVCVALEEPYALMQDIDGCGFEMVTGATAGRPDGVAIGWVNGGDTRWTLDPMWMTTGIATRRWEDIQRDGRGRDGLEQQLGCKFRWWPGTWELWRMATGVM